MSIQAVAWALDQKLPARPKLVLVSIANHANHTDGYCWLRIDTIAAEASCSERAVFNFLGALVRNGFVRKAQRRADDGRQRANDYWILLDRDPDRDWIKDAVGEPDEAEDVAGDADADMPPEHTDPQDDGDGLHAVQSAETAPVPVEKPARAVGPTAPACSHIDSAEPSKIKPEESARARPPYRPRAYVPPPPPRPPAQGEVLSADPSKAIFVFYPSDAYDAWARHESTRSRLGFDVNGRPRWKLTTTKVVDGKAKQGWYFPTLYPPSHADPPQESEKKAS